MIQHANLEKQEKYLPLIEKAVEIRDLDKSNLPYLVDRIRMGKKIPQLYGTQLVWSKEKEKLELYPIEDVKNVDLRRDKMNLIPLKEYLQEYNIDTFFLEKN